MIPIKLEINNFMSYQGHHELDFTGFHTASIVGSNGSGKSAILDAITWVLFGKSRITRDSERKDGTKERNDIINCYSSFCQVSLEFELEGKRYLVDRRIDKNKTGQGVQFKMLTKDGERDLRGKGASDAEIEKELGVSFKVFLTSSFITQGDSSRFMEANPRERREILAEILELDVYDRCLETASEQLKEAKKSREMLEEKQKTLTDRALLEPDIERKLEIANTQLGDSTRRLEMAKREREKLAIESTELDSKISALIDDEKKINELQNDQTKLNSEISKWNSEIAKSNSVIASEVEIELGYKQYCESKKKLDLLNELSAKNAEHEKQIQKLQFQIGLEENNISNALRQKKIELLESQKAAQLIPELEILLEESQSRKNAFEIVQTRLSDFDVQLVSAKKDFDSSKSVHDQTKQKLDLKLRTLGAKDATQASDELAGLPELSADFEKMQLELESAEDKSAQIKTTIQLVKADIIHFANETKLLEQGETGNCPLCGQPLGQGRQEELLAQKKDTISTLESKVIKLESEYFDLTKMTSRHKACILETGKRLARKPELETIIQLSTEFDASKTILESNTNNLEQIKFLRDLFVKEHSPDISDKASIEKEILSASHKLEEARSKSAKMNELLSDVSSLDEKLARKLYAIDEQKQLEIVKIQKSKLGFDPALLVVAKDETSKLAEFDEKKRMLDRAKDSIANAESALEQSKSRFYSVKSQIDSLSIKLEGLPDLKAKKTEATKNLDNTRANELAANNDRDLKMSFKNNLERDLKNSQEAKSQLEELSSKLLQNDREIKILEECKKMFGVDGIPSQILEGVIPELQEMANSILTDISQGRVGSEGMKLQIETMKEGTTKQTKTLGIIITDGKITRPYELFSGGERFRADFAIRIALSQLLAQRSGRRLRTLVIDEGFGTQDDEGIRRLIESIQDVAEKFDKVLIISHVDELKNAFEKRILVRRDADTSSFEVI